MKPLDLRDQWVVVTGASSGLGRELALQLARDYRARVVLVARSRARLDALASEIVREHSGIAHVLVADLTCPEDVERVYRDAVALGDIRGVILNAGVTYFGPHTDLSFAEFEAMLATNVTSVVRLASLFLPRFVAQASHAGIMLVSSLGGAMPLPYQSAYSGTKAFLIHFGRALAYELRGTSAAVTVVAAGGIETAMNQRSGLAFYYKGRPALMPAADVARSALDAFVHRRSFVVPGVFNRIALVLSRVLPTRLTLSVLGRSYGRALATKEARVQPTRAPSHES